MPFQPEKAFLQKTTSDEHLSISEEVIYENLVRKQIAKKPKIEDYKDVFREDEIKNDQCRLETVVKGFDKYSTQRSEILEAILLNQIEMSNWFGENCFTVQTTKFDDVLHHTDFVVEWPQGRGKALRVGVDVTVTNDRNVIYKKLDFITRDLDKKRGTTIKYFQSEINNKRGKIENLPRLIIALSKEGLSSLCDEFAKTKNIDKEKRKFAKQNLEYNPLQISIIKDLIEQIEAQIDYLIDKNQKEEKPAFANDSVIFTNLIMAKNNFTKILNKKKSSLAIISRQNRALEAESISRFF